MNAVILVSYTKMLIAKKDLKTLLTLQRDKTYDYSLLGTKK